LSLKENIDAIKDELSAEEKFLESVIKTESFYKKNKKLIISLGLAVFLGVAGSMGYNYYKEENLKASNEIYTTLLTTTKDTSTLESQLKSKNPKLWTLYKVQTALKTNDKEALEKLLKTVDDPILKNLVEYQLSSLNKEAFLKYIGQGEAVMKDFAYLDAGYKALEKGDVDKAEDIFGFITPSSPLYRVVQSLRHYTK